MGLQKIKTEAGHKAGRTGRKSQPRAERKVAARKRRRWIDRLAKAGWKTGTVEEFLDEMSPKEDGE